MTCTPYSTFFIDANPAIMRLSPYLLSFGRWGIQFHSLTVTDLPPETNVLCKLTTNLVQSNQRLNIQLPRSNYTPPKYQPLEIVEINSNEKKRSQVIHFSGQMYQVNNSDELLHIFLEFNEPVARGAKYKVYFSLYKL